MKLPGVISLRKLLPIWPMPNGGLLRDGRLHVEEVDEDALRRLRAQVVQALLGLHRAEVGLEHHVEVARLGVLAAGAAVRARDVGQVVLGWRPCRCARRTPRRAGRRGSACGSAVHSTSGSWNALRWPGRDPHLARQDHRAVEADDVLAAGDHRLPPLPLDVLLELHAERAVVPRRAGAAVDLAGGEDEPPALAQRDDGVDLGGRGVAGHGRHSTTVGLPEGSSVPSGRSATAGTPALPALEPRKAVSLRRATPSPSAILATCPRRSGKRCPRDPPGRCVPSSLSTTPTGSGTCRRPATSDCRPRT